jgi:hypothetical protein
LLQPENREILRQILCDRVVPGNLTAGQFQSGEVQRVDRASGFTAQDQTDLIQFLLSIDDDPAVLPDSVVTKSQ